MEKKCYIVEAKCGHVGRNNYTVKKFPTKALSASKAANRTRKFGRVKHHWKDAIISVRECTYEEYREQVLANNNDPYFHATCIQEQRLNCKNLAIVFSKRFEEETMNHKEVRVFHRRRDRQERREASRMIREWRIMPAYAY